MFILNDVTFNSDVADMVLMNLDGWVIEPIPEVAVSDGDETTTVEVDDGDVNPFMTTSEAEQKPNKMITIDECKLFYEEALDLAYMHTNRLNVDDLSELEVRIFQRGVCKWAASNLWNKYSAAESHSTTFLLIKS